MTGEFSRIARQGLIRLIDDAERRISYEYAIRHHLSNPDVWRRSRRLAGRADVMLYAYALIPGRVVWEQRAADHVIVWSVTKLKSIDLETG